MEYAKDSYLYNLFAILLRTGLRNKYEIRQVIKKIRKDGKEFPDITPHVFRHTFATRAIEEGMPPQVLKTIMGHSSLAITMDLYSHVMEDTKQKEMLSIANAF